MKLAVENNHLNGKIVYRSPDRVKNDVLVPNSKIFSDDYTIMDEFGHLIPHQIDHLVTGKIINEANSLVHGSLVDGILSGVIKSENSGTYFIERSIKNQSGNGFLIPMVKQISRVQMNWFFTKVVFSIFQLS